MSSSFETTKQGTGSAAPQGLGTVTKIIVLVAVMVGIGGGLAVWKVKHGHGSGFDRITKAEMEALLKDANPMVLKQMADDPAMKEKQLESLKELLSMASAAEKELGSDPVIQRAMGFIESITIARNYDQELHKDAGPMPPFGFITEDQIKAFYGEGQAEGSAISAGEKNKREELFKQFLDTQLSLAKRNKSIPNESEPTEEELKQLRDEFARIKIYEDEARAKIASDPANWGAFASKISIQTKLQRANFLARLYQEEMAEKAKVTDEEINKYLEDNPQLSNAAEKKAKAEEILGRLKAGEDFAALAKEFSEDPGSKDKGGLYENMMQGGGLDANFEAAALALEPGQFTSAPVETQFGYHIIKLEKKGEAKGADGEIKVSFDVRHILISTQVTDPENPFSRPMPVKEYARTKVEEVRKEALREKMVKDNPVVIEEFEIPAVSDAQIEEMRKQQMPQAEPEEKGGTPEKKDKGTAKPGKTKGNG